MISNITIAADGAGQFQINYTTTLGNVHSAYVNFGADTAYGQMASGQLSSVNADGSNNCNVPLGTTMTAFHFQCVVMDDMGVNDVSTDQAYGGSSTGDGGGGSGDGDHGRGHGDDDHGRGGDGHGHGDDGHGHGDDGRGRGGNGHGDDGHGKGGDDHGRGGDGDGGRGGR